MPQPELWRIKTGCRKKILPEGLEIFFQAFIMGRRMRHRSDRPQAYLYLRKANREGSLFKTINALLTAGVKMTTAPAAFEGTEGCAQAPRPCGGAWLAFSAGSSGGSAAYREFINYEF